MKNLPRIVAIVGLASFVLLAPSDHAQVRTASEPLADSIPSPALPVHVWNGRQHITGLLAFTGNRELRFSELLREESELPARVGFWIELWKIDALGHLLPATLRQFDFAEREAIVVGKSKFVRISPADPSATVRASGPVQGQRE